MCKVIFDDLEFIQLGPELTKHSTKCHDCKKRIDAKSWCWNSKARTELNQKPICTRCHAERTENSGEKVRR